MKEASRQALTASQYRLEGDAPGRTAASAEKARMPAETSNALRALGWNIVEGELWSGTHAIQVTPKGLVGGADPREEGKAVALPALP